MMGFQIYRKGGEAMKKLVKIILVVIASVFIIGAVFWGSIVYVSDYKVTTVGLMSRLSCTLMAKKR